MVSPFYSSKNPIFLVISNLFLDFSSWFLGLKLFRTIEPLTKDRETSYQSMENLLLKYLLSNFILLFIILLSLGNIRLYRLCTKIKGNKMYENNLKKLQPCFFSFLLCKSFWKKVQFVSRRLLETALNRSSQSQMFNKTGVLKNT